MQDIIDQLIYERAPWLQTKTTGAAISDRVLKTCLQYSKTIEIANTLKLLNGAEIFDKLCGEIPCGCTASWMISGLVLK